MKIMQQELVEKLAAVKSAVPARLSISVNSHFSSKNASRILFSWSVVFCGVYV